jgi:uncharacterized MAPEG superfamily protein
MASSNVTPNYSLLTIPVYMVVANMPHAYSVYLIGSNNNWKWDNASPRSANNKTQCSNSVAASIYRKYERCRAAHDNMLENMAFVIGGILSGVICKLDATWMNNMCAIYLLSRILYALSYIMTSSQRWSPLRTVWYLVGSIVVLAMYWKAGWRLVEAGQLP